MTATSGGLAGFLATGRAPAYAQATSIHWVRWSDFVPASDSCLREKIVPECEKALGIKLRFETINANDIQARVTSAIQSGSGPDIIMSLNNWPQLYATSLADVSDVAEEIGKAQGGYYDICKTVGTYQGKWIGVPWAIGGGLSPTANRGSPKWATTNSRITWDQWHDAGKKLKAKGRPIGQTLGHTFGDAPGFWYPVSVVVGRQGGRGRRQDRRAEQQGDGRIGQIRDRLLERLLRPRRARLGRQQQQPRVSVRHDQLPPTTAPRSISKPRRSPTHI